MNSDELKELLRLTAIALGDGWELSSSFGDPCLQHPDRYNRLYPEHSDGDSRWLECELGLCIVRDEAEVAAFHPGADITAIVQVAQFSSMLEAARWAVLECAAAIGAVKEGEK